MAKVNATYTAPEGDSEVVHMRGVRFIDGQATELDTDEHAALIAKLRHNGLFTVDGDDPAPVAADTAPAVDAPARRGRPPKSTVTE